MWNQPWKLAEGFLIGAVLVATGLLLQFTFGPVNWDVFAFPFNILVLVVFLLLVAVAFFLRAKVYAFRYLGSSLSAIPALCYAVGLTAVMGLTRQVPSAQPATDLLGLTHMLSFWPFVLVYVWIAFILGIVTLKRLTGLLQFWEKSSPRRDIPFLLNHLGLFITMTTATLGNADMQRLKMTISSEGPEWRAVDDEGRMHELPIAIRLEDFRIDEYPPKLVMVDNNTGRPMGGKQAETLFGAATVMAVYQLFFASRTGRKGATAVVTADSGAEALDITDNLISVGYCFMTLGMLFGALWAKEAWGHYWSWDPKETWAAITWFAYLVYIHLRTARPRAVRPSLWILVLAFVLLQMCWWGINYLPSAQGTSVHTYTT